MTGDEWVKLRSSEWFDHVPQDEAARFHTRNVERVRQALSDYQQENRGLRILALYGSGRSVDKSCAHEESNSKLLLRTGLQVVSGDVEIEEVELRQHAIEPCNGCYSTSSCWCHFPCTCFPFDAMQDLYPMVLRADVLLMATPVNQSMPSTRLKMFIDRLISLDGGMYVPPEQLRVKDEKWKRQWMQIAASGNFAYSPRMAGRVCAYFITSKDQNSPLGDPAKHSYETLVSESLKSSMHDYGCVHANPWYVLAAAKPDVELQFDKQHYNRQTDIHERAKVVVKAALELAGEVRKHGYKPPLDRVNRT